MPFLVLNQGAGGEQKVVIRPGITVVGRAVECDLVIEHTSLSRRHASLEVGERGTEIVDLGSKNGTFVNGTRVDRQVLANGDVVRLGSIEARFVTAERTEMALPVAVVSDLDNIKGTALLLKGQDQASRSLTKLKVLLQVSEVLSSPQPIERLLERTLELLFLVFEVDRAAIYLVNEQSAGPELVAARRGPGVACDAEMASRQILGDVLRNETAVLCSDAVQDSRFSDAPSVLSQSIHSSMCVPLRCRDRVIGVVYVDSVLKVNLFTSDDLEFLGTFANHAAIAIENARLYRRIEDEAILRNSLFRFFPPAVAAKLMATPDVGLGSRDTNVTILFSDITSFTALSSGMEPGQIVELLNEYFPLMAEIVFRHGGTLEKYIGDALMAVWGAPFAEPDDADRAVKAAVDMQRGLADLNGRWAAQGRREIAIHIGVNTGCAAAGNIGSASYIQYAVIGDATNVASRICSVAGPGEILIAEATRQALTGPAPALEPLAPVQVRGKDEAVCLHRVMWRSLATHWP